MGLWMRLWLGLLFLGLGLLWYVVGAMRYGLLLCGWGVLHLQRIDEVASVERGEDTDQVLVERGDGLVQVRRKAIHLGRHRLVRLCSGVCGVVVYWVV